MSPPWGASEPPERWARSLVCSRTGERAPLDEPASVSPAGAPWLVAYELAPERGPAWRAGLSARPWSLWRYRELLPVRDFGSRVDLGEGGTPLVHLRRTAPPGIDLWAKDESRNPAGSFKARGLSLAVNRARELGAPGVELASAGNAGVALAAYAAAADLRARVAVPSGTPRAIVDLCRAHGAEVVVAGDTLLAAASALADRPAGCWSLNTLREPYRVEGKKTMGLEVVEQMGWRHPDWLVYPTGGGTGIVGMDKAFAELERLGLGDGRRPRLAVVQMEGCAPLVRAFQRGAETAEPWEAPRTRAWGLRVPAALGDFLVLRAVRMSGGTAIAVPEASLEPAAARAARQEGLAVGPESAAALAAVDLLAARGTIRSGERVVVFLTGHPANYR